MRSKMLNAILTTAAFMGVLLTSGISHAADVYLQAQSFDKTLTLPDLTEVVVPMWGFATCLDDTFTSCDLPTATDAPGPQINLATTDTLTIHLNNTLSTPVSIVIPGQAGAGDPTFFTDGAARQRVQSFTHEASAGGTALYTWTTLRPGTYLYQSGTHPSIQVPMGLYGALVVGGPATPADGTCGTGQQAAYDTVDSCYDADAVMIFSELDPLQNAMAAAATSVAGYPSTVNYSPTYLLVNGELSAGALSAGDPGDSVMLRFLNAGLRTHTPSVVGLDMGLFAEDGNPYPGLMMQQSMALLPAGKTIDALVTMPATNVTLPLFDRMPTFSNSGLPDGGMVANLDVGVGSPPPPVPTVFAVDDIYDPVAEDSSPYSGASVLSNDTGLSGATVTVVSPPSNGTLAMNTAGVGTFDYTPNENFSGTDGFTYSASLGGNSYPAQATLNVSFVNDIPMAANDGPYVNAIGSEISVAAPGVLGNDMDPDGDTMTAHWVSGAGVILAADGSFTYTGSDPSFTYSASDDGGVTLSAPATATLNSNPIANIALTVLDPLDTAVSEYRWIVQENAAYINDPNAPESFPDQQVLNFHKSSMPVVAQGSGPTEFAQLALDPAKHYYVSVLPDDAGSGVGHSIGGAQMPPGTTAVTVIVNNQPIPTSQVAVIVFEDNQPTNGVPDPTEEGMGGFQITLEDAGGRYGISGGAMSQDAFGMPLTNSLECAPDAAPGVIVTCADGTALIKDLPPAKYGIIAVAPAGMETWTQTSTIEGTKVVDAWVEAGNPPFFAEFGVPAFHAFIGFVNPDNLVNPGGANTITGSVTLLHESRPPNVQGNDSGSFVGFSHTRAWVGVNSNAGAGPNIATVPVDDEGNFTITGMPDGTHQLVIWDAYLDIIMAYHTVILPDGGDVGNIPVNAWFTRTEHNVFLDDGCGDPLSDLAGNGIRDDCGGGVMEAALSEQAVNLRWRDGTVNQSFPTDLDGFVPFDQIFPFFHWQVVEVDYTRFKATGLTVTVDSGNDSSGEPYPGLLDPQQQGPCTQDDVDNGWNGCSIAGLPYANPNQRTETGQVLTQAFQGFPGQTSIFDWGKAPYEVGENGGISGIVFYGSTRGENDPRLTVGDPWEPGIARVKVRLYREVATEIGGTALALVEEVTTDSWDDSQPTDCLGEIETGDPFVDNTLGIDNVSRCYDGWRNWNQARPGVFDGGYAFNDIPAGNYVVEVAVPPGYELIKEEDLNVGFGDAYETAPVAMMLPGGAMVMIMPAMANVLAATGPEPGIAQPPCVGDMRLVPLQLSLFPDDTPFGGDFRPLCDRKAVVLSDEGQAASDFHLFTSTPVAAQFSGLITDDIATETNPAAPGFGEKWSPAYLPFSMRDFNGQEVYRGYSDAFGHFNGVLASSFTANVPIPSGYSPNMILTCLNDPGDGPILDPLVNPAYGPACYTLQFMPGATTYLDTPMLPQAAFAAGFNPVDCAAPTDTPMIASVNPLVAPGALLEIFSMGRGVDVPNPAYTGPLGTESPTITRDFDFGQGGGSRGTVELVSSDGIRTELVTQGGGTGWTRNRIRARAPGTSMTGELVITRGDGGRSVNTVTVTVSADPADAVVTPGPGTPIQDAIDAAAPGDLILVEEGTYKELVVMWKPVRLQGAGAATIIDAAKRPNAKLETWRLKVKGLIDAGTVDLLPGQPTEFDFVGPGLFSNELGGGITVLANDDGSFGTSPSRIDGFTITNADGGGAIFVNGYAHNLEIGNNNITGNSGVLHGGIRIGHPYLQTTGTGPFAYNTGVNIHHNAITKNGGLSRDGAGGGVSLNTGSDDYTVAENFVCGNFKLGDGGGIGHLGLSNNGVIESNDILFNQSFNQGLNRSGGGILVGGEPAAGGLGLGAGDVTIDANRIQGNQAGSGHGAGIRTQFVNGAESIPWIVRITNNMIVNNVTGWSGAGISLQDTTNASIINNTIAHNDSTASVGALLNAPGTSTPQPAGISAERHSQALAAVVGPGFSNPTLFNNIVWENRAFNYGALTAGGFGLLPELVATAVGGCPTGASYWDLGVLGESIVSTTRLNPTDSILTDSTGYDVSNLSGEPDLLSAYCNGARDLNVPGPMLAAAAAGEGGNFVDVRYGPLSQLWPAGSEPWDYHIGDASAGLNNGNSVGAPTWDFDNDVRPQQELWDRGADELPGPPIGACSDNADNAGASCLIDDDCPPNGGNPANQGTCVFP
jgi:hypothetical protein